MNPEIRRLFPGALDQVYLDLSARGLMPTPVREAIQEHLRVRMREGGDKDRLWALVDRARRDFAALIHAAPDEVAITKNVSEGLNLFGASLPWEEGDNVVLCPGLEHPNNVYLWYNLQTLRGIEVRAVEPVDGRVSVEAMAAAMDEDTRLVTVPSISFAPGFVTDVDGIARAARAVGALTLVDAAQSVGALEIDVRASGVDALAVAAQKCLLADYGTGFLYIRKAVAEGLVPIHVARYGMELGGAHETAFSESGELVYKPGALRFDLGNYNYGGAAGAGAALRLLHEWTVPAVERYVRALAARLARGFASLGLPVVGGAECPDRAHIVTVGESGGGRHYTAEDPSMNALREALLAGGIVHSIRSGMLRFSVGVYNDEADIDRTLEVAGRWAGGR